MQDTSLKAVRLKLTMWPPCCRNAVGFLFFSEWRLSLKVRCDRAHIGTRMFSQTRGLRSIKTGWAPLIGLGRSGPWPLLLLWYWCSTVNRCNHRLQLYKGHRRVRRVVLHEHSRHVMRITVADESRQTSVFRLTRLSLSVILL